MFTVNSIHSMLVGYGSQQLIESIMFDEAAKETECIVVYMLDETLFGSTSQSPHPCVLALVASSPEKKG